MHNYESFNGRVYEIPITNIGKKPKRKFVHPLNKRLNKINQLRSGYMRITITETQNSTFTEFVERWLKISGS